MRRGLSFLGKEEVSRISGGWTINGFEAVLECRKDFIDVGILLVGKVELKQSALGAQRENDGEFQAGLFAVLIDVCGVVPSLDRSALEWEKFGNVGVVFLGFRFIPSCLGDRLDGPSGDVSFIKRDVKQQGGRVARFHICPNMSAIAEVVLPFLAEIQLEGQSGDGFCGGFRCHNTLEAY